MKKLNQNESHTQETLRRLKMPYIGVTGCMHAQEITEISNAFTTQSPRILMNGILVSYPKSFNNNHSKWKNKYPPLDIIDSLLIDNPNVVNLIHFNTDTQPNIYEQLEYLSKIFRNLHGFQLNNVFPSTIRQSLEKIKERSNSHRMVLQVGRHMFEEYGNITNVLNEINLNKDIFTDILLDLSGGEGRNMNLKFAYDFLSNFYNLGLNESMGAGIAGGLGNDNLDEIEELIMVFPNISIDAQGKLSTTGNSFDSLDTRVATEYVRNALKIFSLQ